MKMAALTESRQFVSIIDSEKIKKIQNLNNNNSSSAGSASNHQRARNDSINMPSYLFSSVGSDDQCHSDWLLKDDCMWSTGGEPDSIDDFSAFLDSFGHYDESSGTQFSSTYDQSNGACQSEALSLASGSDAATVHANSTAAHSLPPSPSPSSSCASAESDTASYALSMLDDPETASLGDSYLRNSLDEAQLHLIFAASPAKRSSTWNEDTKPVALQRSCIRSTANYPTIRRGAFALKENGETQLQLQSQTSIDESDVKGVLKVEPMRERLAVKRPPSSINEYPIVNKMRRTVVASAARLGRAVSNFDCEVIIRDDEFEVGCEVDTDGATSDCANLASRDCAVPRRTVYTRDGMGHARNTTHIYGPSSGLQRSRPNSMHQTLVRSSANRFQRTVLTNLINPSAKSAVAGGSQLTFNSRIARASSFNQHQVASFANRSALSKTTVNRHGSIIGNRAQLGAAPYGQEGVAYASASANRLLGRPFKRFSLPSTVVSSNAIPSDMELNVSMSAPRRGSSSYCSQMERNRRREMNSALAALRRLILEDDRSLLSKVYAENQINRRNTSMIMTLRAAHDAILKLNETARRAHEERLEQLRKRERMMKRLQMLQTACHSQTTAQPAVVSVKSEWS